jgi:hypothetical protein
MRARPSLQGEKMRTITLILTTTSLILAGCAPTASTQDVGELVMTSVAETLAAQGAIATSVAATVAAQRPAVTATLAATGTPFPTFTPLATVTRSAASGGSGGSGGSGSGGTGSGGAGAPRYDCAVVAQRPGDGTLFKPGDFFDVVWTLKNVGTKPIPAGSYFQLLDTYEDFSSTGNWALVREIAPNDTFDLRIDAFAPAVTGREKVQFTMQWALTVEGTKICKPFVAIFVQRPGG